MLKSKLHCVAKDKMKQSLKADQKRGIREEKERVRGCCFYLWKKLGKSHTPVSGI